MSKSYPIVERLADEVIVTARSTVEAQQAAGEAMGGDCTIVSVERIHEGGIGGFFATELVRVTARPSRFSRIDRELDAAMTSAEELVSSLRTSSPIFADRLMSELRGPRPKPSVELFDHALEQIVAEPVESDLTVPMMRPFLLDEPEAPVAAMYTAHAAPAAPAPELEPEPALAHEQDLDEYVEYDVPPIPIRPAVSPAPVAPIVHHRCSPLGVDAVPTVPRRSSQQVDPRWSHQTLRAIGLPDRVVDIAMLQRPVEGPQWIMALMGAFRTLCAPSPVGPTVLVGPSCANLARQLRLVSVGAEELHETLSSVALPNVSTAIARSALNDRYVHVMVGGQWQHLASIPSNVVSAATDADLLEAVRLCCAWDATLGWSLVDDRYERIDEFTLVAHVRSIICGIPS